jgi:hypothetical protein
MGAQYRYQRLQEIGRILRGHSRPNSKKGCGQRRIELFAFEIQNGSDMPSVTIKDLSEHLHSQLKREPEANFRSLNQEVLARIQRSFELDAALNTKRDQKWIEEAIASGPAASLTEKEMNAIRDRVLKRKAK